ncbi:MAG: Fe-S-cluster containining protein [Cognaticolwellia sp.]|jgi:Fe-S-cluster containining protein
MSTATLGTLRHVCAMCGGSCQGVNVSLSSPEELAQVISQAELLGVTDPAPEGVLRRVGGRCVFLGDDELCRIHAAWGMSAKPKVCQQYPMIATRVGEETRVGLDPGCFHSVKSWVTGPEVPGGSLMVSVSEQPDALLPHEERVMSVLEQADTIEQALAMLIPGDLEGFLGRWIQALQAVDFADLLADPDTSPSLRHSLGPMAQILPTWTTIPGPPELSDNARSFALHAAKRMVWLRLCPKIPSPAVVALLSLGGVMACGWTNPEDAAFGQALAGWMRAIRAPAVLGRLLPSPQSLQALVEG